ncbi:MAG TPA: hypothetical protein VK656_03480 [Candidatus Acidoferrum sp.]|nr:hypothetical protein [Candidatus Acidoferrum sp.]
MTAAAELSVMNLAPVTVIPTAIDEPVSATRPPLEVELATTGARLRNDRAHFERPEPDFVQKLRAQLLEQLPATRSATAGIAGSTGVVVGRRTSRWSPRVAVHTPSLKRAPSWAAAIAAGLIIGIVGLGAGRTIFTPVASPASQAVDATGATLVRAGQATTLSAGTALRAGDEIRTAAGGHAVVSLGTSQARLAGSSDLIVSSLGSDKIALDQVAGRIYHRVSVPAGSTYVVETAGVTWTAHGTAFDLDRESEPGGGTRLTLLAVEHSVIVDGPGVSVTVPQGRQADIVIGAGSDAPDLSMGSPGAATLADPWLAGNAALDVADGFDPGVLSGVAAPSEGPTATPSATPTPTATPIPTPISTPSPSPSPSAELSASPSSEPTPSPTPGPASEPPTQPTIKPTPSPTPEPVQALDLAVKACPGATLLDWTAASGTQFDHYKTYRSSSASLASPVLVSGATTSSRSATSGADAGASGTHYYRTYAYDSSGHVIGKSQIRSATGLGGAASMNPFVVGSIGPSQIQFSWQAPATVDGCSGQTKLIYTSDGTPVYGHSDTELLWASSDPSMNNVALSSAPVGTWTFRIQMVRSTDLGYVVLAQTLPVQYQVTY